MSNVHDFPYQKGITPEARSLNMPILPTSGDFVKCNFKEEPSFSEVQLEIIQTYIEQIEILLDGMRRCTKLKV